MRAATFCALVCATALMGCESAVEPVTPLPEPSYSAGPVEHSAFGSAGFTPGEIFRIVSFTAIERKDRSASGSFQWNYARAANRGLGTVTCLSVRGSEAWIGGVITYHATHPEYVGLEIAMRAVDNRGVGIPDQISLIAPIPYEGPEGVFKGYAADFCREMPEFPPVYDLESGNLVVTG
ncbi:MAG: hypothetical protein LJF04_04515 [Gemmatimonadetes bacterium]|nr:hypothetical protein [Gemmatimonadota bacterium]